MEKTEEYRKWKWLIKQQYPRPNPCIKCRFWTGRNYGRTIIAEHCDYIEIMGHSRDCLPDLENGTCEKFEKRKKK